MLVTALYDKISVAVMVATPEQLQYNERNWVTKVKLDKLNIILMGYR